VRDVEAALAEAFEEPLVSKSTVSRICSETRERYRAWCGRRLDEHDLVYLFLADVYLKLRPDDTPAEGVLVAWGVTLEGKKVLLGLQLGSRESYQDWLDFGRDLLAGGLDAPSAKRCLRNFAQLTSPGGYLFVSGVDLDVRTNVAIDLEWEPVPELMAEIHDGDPLVRADWPWHWWGPLVGPGAARSREKRLADPLRVRVPSG
jgi:hypothetical protein